jgi:hypothetical protein
MRAFLGLLILALGASAALSKDVRLTAATRDAESLVERMKNFDTDGVAAFLYTAPIERMGVNLESLRESLARLNANLRSTGAKYLTFTLEEPTEPFGRPEGLFTIIPYSCVMTANGKTMQQDAFFIGFSGDSGASWKFIDGIGTAKVPIDTYLPNYAGPELPVVRRYPVSQSVPPNTSLERTLER